MPLNKETNPKKSVARNIAAGVREWRKVVFERIGLACATPNR